MTATHAQYRAAKQKLQEAEAELRQTLPFLSDDAFVLISAELDARMLGRLGCAAQRFWRKSVREPARPGAATEMWSVPEEGARRRLGAQTEQVRGWVQRGRNGSWLRALAQVEKMMRPLRFTACPPWIRLYDGGMYVSGEGSAMCKDHKMLHGRHCASFGAISLHTKIGVIGAGFDPTVGALPEDFSLSWMCCIRDDSAILEWGGGCGYHVPLPQRNGVVEPQESVRQCSPLHTHCRFG